VKNAESTRRPSAGPIVKLLVIVPAMERGGAETYALKVAASAAPLWKVEAAVTRTPATRSLIHELEGEGVSCRPFPIPKSHFLAMADEPRWKNVPLPKSGLILRTLFLAQRATLQVREAWHAAVQFFQTAVVLISARPDVVLLNICWPTFGMGMILACACVGMPTAVVFHSHPFPFSFRSSKVRLYNWARRRRQTWITVSDSNQRLICGTFHLREADVIRIYNGISLPAKVTGAARRALRAHVRDELQLPRSARLLLTVGRLDANKGHGDLIMAIPHLLREFPDLRFVWAGEGPNRQSLTEKLKEYGVLTSVLLLGYRTDVERLMSAADLFVLPSRFEGFPFTILEAMAQGLTLVSTDAGDVPEMLRDGVHGMITRVGDSCGLLEALRWVLRHPARMSAMARNARVRAADFSQERMLRETRAVLASLARPTKSGQR
jgi:glycosyltransferase involved in cell wall biosynthesis